MRSLCDFKNLEDIRFYDCGNPCSGIMSDLIFFLAPHLDHFTASSHCVKLWANKEFG